jgi:hypothetical protein
VVLRDDEDLGCRGDAGQGDPSLEGFGRVPWAADAASHRDLSDELKFEDHDATSHRDLTITSGSGALGA